MLYIQYVDTHLFFISFVTLHCGIWAAAILTHPDGIPLSYKAWLRLTGIFYFFFTRWHRVCIYYTYEIVDVSELRSGGGAPKRTGLGHWEGSPPSSCSVASPDVTGAKCEQQPRKANTRIVSAPPPNKQQQQQKGLTLLFTLPVKYYRSFM